MVRSTEAKEATLAINLMRIYSIFIVISSLMLVSTGRAEVKSIQMKIAGYLCGN